MAFSLIQKRTQLAIATAAVFLLSLVYLGFRQDLPFTTREIPYSGAISSQDSLDDVHNQTLGVCSSKKPLLGA